MIEECEIWECGMGDAHPKSQEPYANGIPPPSSWLSVGDAIGPGCHEGAKHWKPGVGKLPSLRTPLVAL